MEYLHDLEARRLAQQSTLDAAKAKRERNRLGQFATPGMLARELLTYAASLMPPDEPVEMLDPACGTGAFFSALFSAVPPERVKAAMGFEVDRHYAVPAQQLWAGTQVRIDACDFTTASAPEKRANLLVSNPPYVRHHHLTGEDKSRLHQAAILASGMRLSGLAGLYCYFMGIAHQWMQPGAVACWLIPSEFMDVNYGKEVKRYLLETVTLLRIHRFDPAEGQFADALVSSAVVWFKNSKPPEGHKVHFTYGGTHSQPRVDREISAVELQHANKWTRFPVQGVPAAPVAHVKFSDIFDIRRGVATGDNSFFILPPEKVLSLGLPWEQMTPILPSPRYLDSDVVLSDAAGNPVVAKRCFLLNCRLPEAEVKVRYPKLWAYLESGREALLKRYLCQKRSLWYLQENRPPAPFLCTYMGRSDKGNGKPFRFILNRSRAVVANTYLAIYPKPHVARRLAERPELVEQVWRALNDIDALSLVSEGRVYGGGLHKMEPKELAAVRVDEVASLLDLLPAPSLEFAA